MTLYYALVILSFCALIATAVHVHLNARLERNVKIDFYCGFCAIALAIAFECSAIMLNGDTWNDGILVKIMKCGDFIFTPLTAVLISLPLTKRRNVRLMLYVITVNAVLEIASIFTGWTFYVVDGIYYHGPYYWLYLVLNCAGLLFLLYNIVMYSRRHKNHNSPTMFCIAFIVILAVVLQTVDGNLRVINLGLTISMMLFVLHYIDFETQDMDEELEETAQLNEQRHNAIKALCESYLTAHLIFLDEGSIVSIVSNEDIDRIIAEEETAKAKVDRCLKLLVAERYLNQALMFADLDTLPERMRERSSISLEFVGNVNGWCRAFFLVVDRKEDGLPASVIFTTTVIEEEKRYEAELLALSTVDSLTGLANQRAYHQMMKAYSSGSSHGELIIMSLDVNGLKEVNDTLGHECGDALLIGAATCIKEAFGEKCSCFRLGGDEFEVITEASREEVEEMARAFDKLVSAWSKPPIKGLSISYGYASSATFPELSPKDLAKKADEAMYEAKRVYYETTGKNRRR